MQPNMPETGYGQPLPPPNVPFVPPPRRSSRLAVSLAALAVVLAAAALVVSLVWKREAPAPGAQPTATPPPLPAQQLFNGDADKALCQAIAPLMKEIVEQNRTFGPLVPGSPEQDAAIPGYRAFVEGWAPRIQAALNEHAEPPRYLTRTLQAFIDDKLLYVELVQPGRVDNYDGPTWIQAGIDYGGPLGTCSKLGINWQ